MERKNLVLMILLVFILNISFLSAEDFGYNLLESPRFNNNTAFVNQTQFWNTITLGPMDDVNSAQFDNIGGTLTIDESHIELIGNDWWLRLDGTTIPNANIGWGGFSITNVDNITIDNNIFFGDENHFLRRGTINFNGLGTNAFSFHQDIEHPEGTIPFIVSVNKTDSDNDAVLIMVQSGLNESNSVLGNSWFIVVNNLTNNLTEYSKCFLVAGLLNETLRVQCDSANSGADLIVQDDIQSFGTMFADGGIRAETLVDFVMNGEDVNIQNGGLHIFAPVTFEQGVVQGDEVTTFNEDFTGGLGSFTNIQVDLGNWFPTANILCDDGDCANAIGVSGVGDIIMEANISTLNINSTSLNFVYSLVNILGANDFEVTVNNNVGSGEVSIFTDSTNNVVTSSQSIALPSSMSNQPKVSIRFNCDVTNTNRQCFVDTINVNGTAIATTLTNVSGFNSVIKFSDGILAPDGFPERGIFYVAENDTIVIRGNATFENIIEQDLNVTSSISLNGTTIFDWAGVITSPLFPGYFLLNGSSVMQGNTNSTGFNATYDYIFGNGSQLTGITTCSASGSCSEVVYNNTDGGYNFSMKSSYDWTTTGVIDADSFDSNVAVTENQANGDFATGDFTGWTAGADWSVVSNKAEISTTAGSSGDADSTLTSSFTPTVGKLYKISFDWTIDGGVFPVFDVNFGGKDIFTQNGAGSGSELIFVAPTTTASLAFIGFENVAGTMTGDIDNVKIEEAMDAYATGTFANTVYRDGSISGDYLNLDVTELGFSGTFGFDLIPSTTNLYDLGSNSARWAEGHITNINTNVISSLSSTGNDLVFISTRVWGNIDQAGVEFRWDGDSQTNLFVIDASTNDIHMSGDLHMENDGDNILLGAGEDMRIGSDGTNGFINVATLLNIQGDTKIDGKLNVSESIEYNGTLITHSPFLTYGAEEEKYFFADYITETTGFCRMIGRNWDCDGNNTEVLNKIQMMISRDTTKRECKANNYSYDRNGCFEMVKYSATRGEVLETYQKEIMELVNITYERFDRGWNVVEVTEQELQGIGIYEDAQRIKEGCGIARGFGLYCEVREVRLN